MDRDQLPPEVARLRDLIERAKKVSAIDYCFGEADRQARDREVCSIVAALARLSASAAAQGEAVPATGLFAEKVKVHQTRNGLRFTVDGGLSWLTTWRANGIPDGPVEILFTPPASAPRAHAATTQPDAGVREALEAIANAVICPPLMSEQASQMMHWQKLARAALASPPAAASAAVREALADALEFIEHYSHAWNGVSAKHPHGIVTDLRAALAAAPDVPPAGDTAQIPQGMVLVKREQFEQFTNWLACGMPAADQPAEVAQGAPKLLKLAAWDHLTREGEWPNGCPAWARNAEGRMDSSTAMRAVIEEMREALVRATPRAEEKPLTEERRLRAVEEHCWDVRCIDLPTGAGDADVGWQVIEHYEAKPHERVRGAMWARTPGEAIDAAIAHVAGDLAIARRAHGIGTQPEAEGGAS